jgi:hypothetical protein
MSHSATLDEIRQRHEEVYGAILRNPELARSGPERDAFLAEQVYPLLDDMKALPKAGMSIEDYAWLSDTAIQWQVVFSSVFNIPRTIQILPPQQLNPPTERYTPGALDELLKQASFFLSQARMLEGLAEYIRHYKSTPAEMDRDWHNAKVALAYWLLEGQVHFAHQIGPESYHHVEEIWLAELQHIAAYFQWIAGGRQLWHAEADYHQACIHIRNKLTDAHIKASRQDFEAVRGYLKARYQIDGEVDTTKEATRDLIARKAYRLWERIGEPDEKENWDQAEAYVKGFYGHIVPAVMENDPQSIKAVLQALQVETRPGHSAIINCFEVLVAVYFLDPNVVSKRFRKLARSAL